MKTNIISVKTVLAAVVFSGYVSANDNSKSGEEVYNTSCIGCHSTGVLGAPKAKVTSDWQPLLDEKGFDTLWKNSITGVKAMPPKGACGLCSDDEIKAAIEYMIDGI
nr:c-type cytochrome [Alteromonas sp. 5E99-2]